jgi:hypothetical protein
MPDVMECPRSKRTDGRHGFRFDGDDPYVICDWCGLIQDALTGREVPRQRGPVSCFARDKEGRGCLRHAYHAGECQFLLAPGRQEGG